MRLPTVLRKRLEGLTASRDPVRGTIPTDPCELPAGVLSTPQGSAQVRWLLPSYPGSR